MTPTDDTTSRWQAWQAAAADPAIGDELRAGFARLDAEIAARSPTCWLSGKCCHFNSYGHRLYVTGLEIAWVLAQSPLTIDTTSLVTMDGCPYQRDKLCGVHAIRPLGCRIYYCDPAAQDWQSDVYESYLTWLRQLHDTHTIPYGYLEWRAGLTEAIDCGISS